MEPTVGRIVIYKFLKNETGAWTNYADEAPAIIVRVWGTTCVNLKVLTDGPHNLWKTSASLGDVEGQWSWPVIKDVVKTE